MTKIEIDFDINESEEQTVTKCQIAYEKVTENEINEKGIIKLKAEIVRGKKEADYLALVLWNKYYKKESPTFELCDTIDGVISQIDNMTSGLTKQKGERND